MIIFKKAQMYNLGKFLLFGLILFSLVIIPMAVSDIEETEPIGLGKEESEVIHINYQTNQYDLGNNKFSQTSSLGFENYKINDEFKSINMTLIDYGSYWKTIESIYYPTIPKYANEWFEFNNVFEENNHVIKTKPIANNVLGILNELNNKVVYKNAFGNDIDLEVYPYNSHMLKQIVINKPQSEELYFEFELEIDDKLNYKSVDEEGFKTTINSVSLETSTNLKEKLIEFEEGKFSTVIYPMKVWDSNRTSEYIESKIYSKDGKLYLRKVISKDFLEKAIYPVYTDDDTGLNWPTSYGDDYTDWGDPADGLLEDIKYAYPNSNGDLEDYYNYGISIPTGSSIDGIVVGLIINRYSGSGLVEIGAEMSWDGGGSYTTTGYSASTTIVKPSKDNKVLGGVSNTWGRTWTAEEFSNTNFRLRVEGIVGNDDLDLDVSNVTVYYTAAAADTCTCAGVDTDWEIDMADWCNVTTACNLGTGYLNFTGAGGVYINSSINSTGMGKPPASSTVWCQDTCWITIS